MKKEERLQKKIDKLKLLLSIQDKTTKHFYGGMVGFKNGTSKRKWEKSIGRELDMICELRYLETELEQLKRPVKERKQEDVIWNVGDIAFEPIGTKVKVVKINKKSVTIEYQDGFRETIKPNLLNK